MATYYVGKGGNDGNSGLTWLLRKLTLNGAEDVPVVADDVIYVGPGAYRETLTLDVSGGVGTPIVYIGDVTGEHTDGIGGLVRITGSDNDITAVRWECIVGAGKDYRTFRGFVFDMTLGYIVKIHTSPDNCIFEDCVFNETDKGVFELTTVTNCTIRRCLFLGVTPASYTINFVAAVAQDDTGNLIENCIILGGSQAISVQRTGGITVKNCWIRSSNGVRITAAPNGGQTVTVNNCILSCSGTALFALAVGEITENYNTFYANQADRNAVNVGGNSVTYPPLWQPPFLLDGFKLPWWFGELSEWSQVRALTGTGMAADDLLGFTRPVTDSKKSWGPEQYAPVERETGTTYESSQASLKMEDAARTQFKLKVHPSATTIKCRVYREANYAGVLPQMVIKEPGQADRTTLDVGAASTWNELSDTWTPQQGINFIIIELVSNNTAAAGNYDVFFDKLEVV